MNELTLVGKDLRTVFKPNKRQRRFIEAWFSPDSDTYMNAYESAIVAGFSEKSARVITGNSRGLQWVQDAKKLFVGDVEFEHVIAGLRADATGAKDARDRIQAWSRVGEFLGYKVDRSIQQVNVSFTNSVPRPITPHVDVEHAPDAG